MLIPISLISASPASGERIFFAGYDGGFYIKSEEEGGMKLRLGGSFQADYRYYLENERSDNRFDIRRARLIFNGNLTRWFRFGMEFEFQGNETNNLVDAYGEAVVEPHALRFGQFKVPFSLEWQSPDKALCFAERSMGNSLGPDRDIGLMIHGAFFQEILYYSIGLFNGDGDDGSVSQQSRQDSPEVAARLVVRPFGRLDIEWLKPFQLGGAATHGKIDTVNIDLKVKSTGMAGNSRNLYTLSANTKFGVLQEADSRSRWNVESAYALGPVAVQAEYTRLKLSELKPSGRPPRDADFSAWYVESLYCLTGETPLYVNGVLNPIYPLRFFNPTEGTYGALVLAARWEHFSGDPDWIQADAHVSVRDADGFSLALNWILFPMSRCILDYSHTDVSDDLRVQVHPDGRVDYVDTENVLTLRFAMDF